MLFRSSLLLVLTLYTGSAGAEGSATRVQSGFSVGPDGVSLGAAGPLIRSDGNGSYVMDFSVTGARVGGPAPAPVVRPPIAAPPSSSSLTDPDEFFRGVGKDSRPAPEPAGRRSRRE